MYRKVFAELVAWNAGSRRKSLVIKGARQVGKTWLMREFAKEAYEDSIYVSFDRNATLSRYSTIQRTPNGSRNSLD
jgi:predicted AAA+ superfamily ATPase